MADEYGAEIISITDDEGKEYELEVLTTVMYQDSEYVAVVPADTKEDEELEVSILRRVVEGDEIYFDTLDSDEELEAVYDLIMDQLYEDADGEDED